MLYFCNKSPKRLKSLVQKAPVKHATIPDIHALELYFCNAMEKMQEIVQYLPQSEMEMIKRKVE